MLILFMRYDAKQVIGFAFQFWSLVLYGTGIVHTDNSLFFEKMKRKSAPASGKSNHRPESDLL